MVLKVRKVFKYLEIFRFLEVYLNCFFSMIFFFGFIGWFLSICAVILGFRSFFRCFSFGIRVIYLVYICCIGGCFIFVELKGCVCFLYCCLLCLYLSDKEVSYRFREGGGVSGVNCYVSWLFILIVGFEIGILEFWLYYCFLIFFFWRW